MTKYAIILMAEFSESEDLIIRTYAPFKADLFKADQTFILLSTVRINVSSVAWLRQLAVLCK